jgi:DNA-binding PadR family transcriptional regulator
MSLPHAILGILNIMPMSGYDLKVQAFDQTVNHFWQAALPQIYRELERMEEKAWLISHVEIQMERPNRRVYEITDAGREELLCWLRTSDPPLAHREAFLIQIFFAWQLQNEEVIHLLDEQLLARHAQQTRLTELTAMFDGNHPRQEAFMRMTLDLGLRLTQMYIAWLEECKRVVQALPE